MGRDSQPTSTVRIDPGDEQGPGGRGIGLSALINTGADLHVEKRKWTMAVWLITILIINTICRIFHESQGAHVCRLQVAVTMCV